MRSCILCFAWTFMVIGTNLRADNPAGNNATLGQEASKSTAGAEASKTAGTGTGRLASPRLTAGLRKSGEKEIPINGFYVAAYGGGRFAGGSDVDYTTDFGDSMDYEGEGDLGIGFLAGMKIGYSHYDKEKELDEFQLVPTIELAGSYSEFKQEVDGQNAGSATDAEADLSLITITANALLKFRNKYVTPYAGLGGGLGIIDVEDVNGKLVGDTNPLSAVTLAEESVTGIDGDESSQFVPVILGIFGLERDVYGPHLSLFMEYEALYIPDADFDVTTRTSGNSARLEFSNMLNHSLQGGVRWNF